MEDLSVSYWKVAFAVVYDYYFDDLFLVFEALKTKATHCHYRLQWRTNCCFDGTTTMNPYYCVLLLSFGNNYILALDIGKSLPVLRPIWIAAYRQDKETLPTYYGCYYFLWLVNQTSNVHDGPRRKLTSHRFFLLLLEFSKRCADSSGLRQLRDYPR